jgi:hypothetical protein
MKLPISEFLKSGNSKHAYIPTRQSDVDNERIHRLLFSYGSLKEYQISISYTGLKQVRVVVVENIYIAELLTGLPRIERAIEEIDSEYYVHIKMI